jgi:antitoxin component of RelBE/YafQ-DinJ toxin-antitoxin module
MRSQPASQPASQPLTPEEAKSRADALGVLIRAGVSPKDAAIRVGLEGIEFTGAVPVSLRLPEQDAQVVEDR